MNPNTFPTKGNLIKARQTLKLCQTGYELIDKKRNVLIKEILNLNEQAKEIQKLLGTTFREAYSALRDANVAIGINKVSSISFGMFIEDSLSVQMKSIMGVEIPKIKYEKTKPTPQYGFLDTTPSFDVAVEKFNKVKELTIELAMVETAAYRLAVSIKKTQRRANALKNVTIPVYEELSKSIALALEEKERDEFTRLKVIKRRN